MHLAQPTSTMDGLHFAHYLVVFGRSVQTSFIKPLEWLSSIALGLHTTISDVGLSLVESTFACTQCSINIECGLHTSVLTSNVRFPIVLRIHILVCRCKMPFGFIVSGVHTSVLGHQMLCDHIVEKILLKVTIFIFYFWLNVIFLHNFHFILINYAFFGIRLEKNNYSKKIVEIV